MIDPTHTQALISSGFPLLGGGAIGFGCGYLLRKLMKLAFLALGAVALLLAYLEYQKMITVNWAVVENQTSTIMAQATHKAYVITQQMGREIPIGLGVLGFMPGMVIGLARG